MTFQHIRLLRGILNDALDRLESIYTSNSLDFPSLDCPFDGSSPNEALSNDKAVSNAVDTAVGAAYQLICTVRQPFLSLSDIANAHHLSACLRVAENLNIPEVLRDAGPKGLHVSKIGVKVNVEHNKLARILRVLTTHHIFQELEPDVFTNNRLSSFFDAGGAEFDRSGEKYHTPGAGMAGYIGHFCDEIAKSSTYLLEHITDKQHGNLYLADKAPLQIAHQTSDVFFSWMERPENAYRLERYAACIRGTSLWDPPESILDGFDWSSLAANSLVVDVGGGTGAPTMVLAKSHVHLRYQIQDREPVIEQARKYWSDELPEMLERGKLTLQGADGPHVHDFFEEQPVHDADIFLLRTVCHDWPNSDVISILRRLRAAAKQSTRLVSGDFLMPFSCPSKNTTDGTHNGYTQESSFPAAPYPMLSNFGKARSTPYLLDMTMLALLNGQERSIPTAKELMKVSGWKVVEVNRVGSSFFGYVVAEPM